MLGSVGVGGSIAILLLVGFVAGAGATWLLFWLKERRQVRIEVGAACGAVVLHARAAAALDMQPAVLLNTLNAHVHLIVLPDAPLQLEYRNRFGDAVRAGLPDVSAMVKVRFQPFS